MSNIAKYRDLIMATATNLQNAGKSSDELFAEVGEAFAKAEVVYDPDRGVPFEEFAVACAMSACA